MVAKYEKPLIEIKWVDAETTYGWENDEEVDHELPIVTTVGFVIKHTVDSRGHGVYIIASTIGGGSCNSRIKIPKNMVVSEKYLYKPRGKGDETKKEKEVNDKVVEELVKLNQS